jgi:hypothetical protein
VANVFGGDLDRSQMTKQISDLPSKIKLAYDVIKHRLWLKHLRGLALMRYGRRWWLPNDVHGQYMLQAMLAAGLTGPDAQRLAPWIGPQQLEDMIQSVDSRTSWDGDALGNMVELTADERERGEFWSMRPCDLDWCRVQEQRRERKREHAVRKRAAKGAVPRAQFLASGAAKRKQQEEEGISRATFYRRRRETGPSPTGNGTSPSPTGNGASPRETGPSPTGKPSETGPSPILLLTGRRRTRLTAVPRLERKDSGEKRPVEPRPSPYTRRLTACEHCGELFHHQRPTARYCSAAHRRAAYRAAAVSRSPPSQRGNPRDLDARLRVLGLLNDGTTKTVKEIMDRAGVRTRSAVDGLLYRLVNDERLIERPDRGIYRLRRANGHAP